MRSPEEQAAWRTICAEYLSSGAIVKADPGPSSRISRAFLVEKGREGGVMKYRLCVDLRQVNRHLHKVGLRYEKLPHFGHLLRKNDYLVGFDIRNAYHHLWVCRGEECFLQFRMGGEVFLVGPCPLGCRFSPTFLLNSCLLWAVS